MSSTDRCLPKTPSIARIVSNQHLSGGIYRALLRMADDWGPSLPGQFVQVECPPREAFAMWRPFSISRFRAERHELELVYGVVGLRTLRLSELTAGEELCLIGPLGRGFEAVSGRRPILIGGGRGIAPMIGLAERWRESLPDGRILYGARSRDLLIPIDDPPYAVWLATEDGSAGFKGNVIELLEAAIARREIDPATIALYACGPNRMLAALSVWAESRGVPCLVSLETHFGCGVGICAGCAVPVRPRDGEDAFARYRFACVEGPVMDGTRVEWEGVAE